MYTLLSSYSSALHYRMLAIGSCKRAAKLAVSCIAYSYEFYKF